MNPALAAMLSNCGNSSAPPATSLTAPTAPVKSAKALKVTAALPEMAKLTGPNVSEGIPAFTVTSATLLPAGTTKGEVGKIDEISARSTAPLLSAKGTLLVIGPKPLGEGEGVAIHSPLWGELVGENSIVPIDLNCN